MAVHIFWRSCFGRLAGSHGWRGFQAISAQVHIFRVTRPLYVKYLQARGARGARGAKKIFFPIGHFLRKMCTYALSGSEIQQPRGLQPVHIQCTSSAQVHIWKCPQKCPAETQSPHPLPAIPTIGNVPPAKRLFCFWEKSDFMLN